MAWAVAGAQPAMGGPAKAKPGAVRKGVKPAASTRGKPARTKTDRRKLTARQPRARSKVPPVQLAPPPKPAAAAADDDEVGEDGKALHLPVAATWTELHRAVQRLRAGYTAHADEDLQRLQRAKDRDLAAAASHVRARLLIRLGQPAAAAKALPKAKLLHDVAPAAGQWAQIELLLAQGKTKAAFDKLKVFRNNFAGFRWAAADLLYSRLHEKVGPPADAVATALALYDKSALHLPRDELLARAARLQTPLDAEKGKALWKKLLMAHPESEFVDEAEQLVPPAGLTDDEQFERVVTLFSRRAYERCRSLGVQLWVRGHRRSEVGYFLGKIGSERLRDDYAGAAVYLAEAIDPQSPLSQNALSSYALVLGKLGRTDEAIARYDEWLKRYPSVTNERRIDLHYDRARTLHMAGQSLRAAADLAAALDADDKGIDAGKYRWFVGFWTLLGGQAEKAIELLKPLMANSNPLVGAKARYWVAKAQDQLGQREAAVQTLLALCERYPLTYYSGLGENLLAQWGAADKLPTREDFSKVSDRHGDPFAGIKMSENVRALRLAASIGEPDVARAAFEGLQPGLRMELGGDRLKKLRNDMADALEQYADARSEALHNYSEVLKKPPTRDTIAQWRAIYPRAFAVHAVAASERYGAPQWMIYAHMLQESAYRPELISGAPAYGLLELLDRTAARLAHMAKEDYQLWMLMQPEYNVRWGGQYLGLLYKKFHRQLPFAIASYNGGPMLMEYHLKQQEKLGRGFDEMIDDLGPHESRNYVRMVIGHFLRYLALYESPPKAQALREQLLPKTWSNAYLAEPDF